MTEPQRQTLYSWATCPCGWQLLYLGMPVGWKPDPVDVEDAVINHRFMHFIEAATSES